MLKMLLHFAYKKVLYICKTDLESLVCKCNLFCKKSDTNLWQKGIQCTTPSKFLNLGVAITAETALFSCCVYNH